MDSEGVYIVLSLVGKKDISDTETEIVYGEMDVLECGEWRVKCGVSLSVERGYK
jgi:hypothetical protein